MSPGAAEGWALRSPRAPGGGCLHTAGLTPRMLTHLAGGSPGPSECWQLEPRVGSLFNATPLEVASFFELGFFCGPKTSAEFAKRFNNQTKLFGDLIAPGASETRGMCFIKLAPFLFTVSAMASCAFTELGAHTGQVPEEPLLLVLTALLWSWWQGHT